MNRRILGAVAAVLLATIGSFVLFAWVQSAEERALAGEATVDVLVVREAVAEGEPAADISAKVELEKVPGKVAAEGSVANLSELDGRVAAVDLQPGEQVIKSRFLDPVQFQEQAGVEVPEGLQELTVALDPQRVVGGQLRPGDTAGVFISFEPFEIYDEVLENNATPRKTPNETHLTFHKVLVTNIQADQPAPVAPAPGTSEAGDGEPTQSAPPSGSAVYVTLAVDAPQAEKIVFGMEFGRLWLSKEPATATEDGTAIQNRGTIYE